MNDSDIERTHDPAESLPKYCDFYKHLLVEELVLESDYRKIHYGKCAVIGRLCAIPDYFRLENVTIPHLPRWVQQLEYAVLTRWPKVTWFYSDYKLPTGAVSLLLLNFTYDKACVHDLAHRSFCIVRGEVVLCNVQKPNSLVLSIRGLHEQLLLLGDNEEARSQYLQQVHQTHKPVLNVWQANRISHAEELIQRRLEIRALCREIGWNELSLSEHFT